MRIILSDIHTLAQHLQQYYLRPEKYKPNLCPYCGLADSLWNHGCYHRQSDRFNRACESFNPVVIPRFYCINCGKTCSVLPECISPRRWYLWATQQTVLLYIIAGKSLREIGRSGLVSI